MLEDEYHSDNTWHFWEIIPAQAPMGHVGGRLRYVSHEAASMRHSSVTSIFNQSYRCPLPAPSPDNPVEDGNFVDEGDLGGHPGAETFFPYFLLSDRKHRSRLLKRCEQPRWIVAVQLVACHAILTHSERVRGGALHAFVQNPASVVVDASDSRVTARL